MPAVGHRLLDLVRGAQSEVTLVSPFIKATTFSRLVDCIGTCVRLVCVTRWHPHEIKAGVSDIEIWKTIQGQGCAKLLLVPSLHAKYYRADHNYVTGSANITMAAFGWSRRPNVELIVSGEVDTALKEWESSLLSQATEVDESLVRAIQGLVDNLPDEEAVVLSDGPTDESGAGQASTGSDVKGSPWIPMTRYPEQLYEAYAGRTERVSAGATETMRHDLWALAIPRGLDEIGFRVAVAAVLLQMPVINEIDRFISVPRTFGAVRDFLGSRWRYPMERDPATDWQTIMRWFRYFLPQRFQVSIPSHSEVIFRIE